MKQTLQLITLLTIFTIGACSKGELSTVPNIQEEGTSNTLIAARMAYSQHTYLCNNSKGFATIYKVGYDFQGLQGNAALTEVASISGHSHIAVSPDKNWVVVVGNGNSKITLVGISPQTNGTTKTLTLEKSVRITQVDFDKSDRLFIAGRKFLEVQSPAGANDIWNLADGTTGLKVVRYSKTTEDFNIITSDEDATEELYFSEDQLDNGARKAKFAGGDILFSQSASETYGFEAEKLISFTRARYSGHKGNAILVNMTDTKNISAKVLFQLEHAKVTGAALVGDNHFMVSTNGQSSLIIYNMHGDKIAEPALTLDGTLFTHKNGDMASTQIFDTAIDAADKTMGISNPHLPWSNAATVAEVKRFRPNGGLEFSVEEDAPTITTLSRKNSANSDIADLRQNSSKFTSLGNNAGSLTLRFSNPILVTSQTMLQVAETSWDKNVVYPSPEAAWAAYPEKAAVYISNNSSRYIGSWIDTPSEWTFVGYAFIAHNEFVIPTGITEFQWVKIIDAGSLSPDGFDVNFVASYEVPAIPEPAPTCEDIPLHFNFNSGIAPENFTGYAHQGSFLPNLAERNWRNYADIAINTTPATDNYYGVMTAFPQAIEHGNVLLVNGSGDEGVIENGERFFTVTTDVAASVPYYFNAEVINLFTPIGVPTPQITLYVDYASGTSESITFDPLMEDQQWHELSYSFVPTETGSATISMNSYKPSHDGNDFAVDNIALTCNP